MKKVGQLLREMRDDLIETEKKKEQRLQESIARAERLEKEKLARMTPEERFEYKEIIEINKIKQDIMKWIKQTKKDIKSNPKRIKEYKGNLLKDSRIVGMKRGWLYGFWEKVETESTKTVMEIKPQGNANFPQLSSLENFCNKLGLTYSIEAKEVREFHVSYSTEYDYYSYYVEYREPYSKSEGWWETNYHLHIVVSL